MADEIHYLLRANIDGVETYSGHDGVMAQVAEWLDTPKGQVWGNPRWGNEYGQFKHNPMGESTAAAMENSTVTKLPEDIPNIPLESVLVEVGDEIDKWVISIGINGIDEPITATITL